MIITLLKWHHIPICYEPMQSCIPNSSLNYQYHQSHPPIQPPPTAPAQSVGGRGGKRSLAGKKELGFSESILLTIPHLFLILWCEVKSLSRVQLYVTPWTVAYQAPPSMGFSRQECWSGVPFPSPGDLPDPGIEPRSPALRADALPSEPLGKVQVNELLNKECILPW